MTARHRHRELACAIGFFAAAALLTGCGGSGNAAPTVTVTAPPAAGATPASPTPDPSASSPDATAEPEGEGAVPSEPRNPVPILKKVRGCVLAADTEVGETDIYGNRYAGCDFLDNSGTPGTSVIVRTYPGDPRQWESTPDNLRTDDSHKIIVGEDFVLTITGDFSDYSRHISSKAVAKQVGGEYQAPR